MDAGFIRGRGTCSRKVWKWETFRKIKYIEREQEKGGGRHKKIILFRNKTATRKYQHKFTLSRPMTNKRKYV